MIFDPLHNILLKMQTALNNTAHDLTRTAGELESERQEKVQALKMVDEVTLAKIAVEVERDALKVENEGLKAAPATTPKSTLTGRVVVGGEDHL